MSDVLITVGITCFNAEKTIERAIRTAIAQSWQNIEILVADDVSKDKSRDVIHQLLKEDSRVRLIKRSVNSGPAATRNTIWREAKGEYIAFFDDDDVSVPERLKIQYERLSKYERQHPQVTVCCYASGKREYPNGYQLHMPAIGSQPEIPLGFAVVDYLLFNGRHAGVFYGAGIPTCALMLRRNVLDQFGGFDENLRRVEDADLAIRIGLTGGHFIGCRENLFLQYATVAPDKTPQKNLDSELIILEKNSKYLREKSLYYYAVHWAMLRYYHFNKQYGLILYTLTKILLRYPIRTVKHLLVSGPNRLNHEKKIASKISRV